MKNNKLLVYGSVILSMIFWSFSFVWVKVVYQVYNPITTVLIRLIISSIFLFLVGGIMGKIERIKRNDLKAFLVIAFFQPFLYFMAESFGLKYISATLGAVVVSTIPLFSPIAAYLFHKEQLSLMNILGIIISILGVAFIIFNRELSLIVSPFGLALMLIAVVAAIGYTTVLKRMSQRYNLLTLISYQNIFGVLFFTPFFLWFDLQHFLESNPTKEVIVSLMELAVFASSLAFLFFSYGLKHLGINKANVFVNVIPVFTAIFAYFVLKDTFTMQKVIGIFIVLAGLFLSQSKLALFSKKKLK